MPLDLLDILHTVFLKQLDQWAFYGNQQYLKEQQFASHMVLEEG